MEERILEIMKRVLENENIDSTCSQRNCETWDSMRQLNLVVELEMEFDINFEPEEIAEMQDYNKVVETVRKKLS